MMMVMKKMSWHRDPFLSFLQGLRSLLLELLDILVDPRDDLVVVEDELVDDYPDPRMGDGRDFLLRPCLLQSQLASLHSLPIHAQRVVDASCSTLPLAELGNACPGKDRLKEALDLLILNRHAWLSWKGYASEA